MKINDKEFYELREQFEKNMKEITYGHRLDRASKSDPVGVFYDDGYVNTMFHAYMYGYEYGKLTERLS